MLDIRLLDIRLLGGCAIRLTDGTPIGRLGPKPQALLAFLAMRRGQAVGRGQLAGLLWGERDEELARHSLSQAVTAIRAALGRDAAGLIRTGPDGIVLSDEQVELDVDRFERAVRSHEPAASQEACRLYRGDFLDGLDVREPGFEDWLLDERYRLRELAADAYARLLEAQTEAGDIAAAVETARRLLMLTPLDEAAHARLIRLYGAQGRRGLAEAHYTRCSALLQRELGQRPGEVLRAALAEARRASARLAVVACDPSGGLGSPTDRPSRPAPGKARRRWVIAVAGAAAMAVLGAGNWILHERREVSEAGSYQAAPWDLPSEPSIAVLPFANLSNDPEQSYLVDGITTDIITDLSRFSSLLVIAANSTFRYQGQAVEVRNVARDLGVRYVLEGGVQRAGEVLRINASLIDATTGRHVWAERYERRGAELFAAQKEIAQKVAAVVGSGWGALQRAEFERIARKPTTSLVAYELFQRGVHHRNLETKEDTAIARRLFEEAVRLDPGYAKAIANLGLTYLDDIWGEWTASREASLQRAAELARRATQVDASEPLAYLVLGSTYFFESRYHEAIALLDKAKALDPNDDHITHALGYALAYSGIAPETGAELLKDMQRRNPYYPEVFLRDLALAYLFAHRDEDALATLNQVARRHRPSYWLSRAVTHVQLGQLDEARAAVAEAVKIDPGLTVEGEHQRRLAMGLAPRNAELLSAALRKAGLPERVPGAQIGASGAGR